MQKGHGITETMMEDVKKLSKQFFALPTETKKEIELSPERGYRLITN